MRGARRRMAIFQVYESLTDYTMRQSAAGPCRCKLPSSCASPPSPVRAARRIPPAMCAASRSSCTPPEGNWDIVGNNMPVFFIQDAIKFPDLIHAAKPEPHNEIPQAASAHDTFWDFISLTPESMHMVMWVMSDRAIPRSFGMMEGFGVHTFRLVNAAGQSRPSSSSTGSRCSAPIRWSGTRRRRLRAKTPTSIGAAMWESIEQGNSFEWELGVQTPAGRRMR